MSTGLPIPDLVKRANRLALTFDFDRSCTAEVGRMLATLSSASQGPLLEIGTGCAVGTAWLLTGLRPDCQLVTVERDTRLAAAARGSFGDVEGLTVLTGDWRTALERGPFDLAFVDVAEAKDAGADEVIDALLPRGVAVLDDFEPGPLYEGRLDERWHRWMHHPRLRTCEVLTAPDRALLIATRI